jgi:hypothetical protein
VRRAMCSAVRSLFVVADCATGDIASIDFAGRLTSAVAATRAQHEQVAARRKDGMLLS